ncbi:MAG: asparaginase, partial [Candidatus Gracilibacteria bacterium]
MKKPKICLLFCGGTIGMVRNPKTGVLEPAREASDLIRIVPEIQTQLQLDYKFLVNVDSSNMTPALWTKIAETIYKFYDSYDGFVIAHGTDTMAYTASALSYALQGLNKPVVLTGSLIPLNEIGSDGRNNLIYACLSATLDLAEVCIVLSDKILRGNRAKKYRESFSAFFHSPNFPDLGELGRPIHLKKWRKKRRNRKLAYFPKFDSKISLLKLYPGFDPGIIDKVLERGAHGIVLEGFGPGNVPSSGENSIVSKIEKATDLSIPVVIQSQMEEGTTNLTSYAAGYLAHKAGAISGGDMTTEATVSKLMWVLAKTRKL